jgi:EAL domain-containing protein (putative c-di-GMP-specific phosphodiesterase class I)
VALVDCGTGHATMEYLAKVDLDLVKIDKSYIEGIETDRTKRVTLMTVIDLIRTCDIQVLCEGVENEAQAKILKEMGVDYGQGYYFGKPVSMDDLTTTATPQSAKVLSMKR